MATTGVPQPPGHAMPPIPANHLFLLPGEFDGPIPAPWYLHRLGLAHGAGRAALAHYLHHLVDLGRATSTLPVKGGRAVAYFGESEDLEFTYLAPRRTKYPTVYPSGLRTDALALWIKGGRKGDPPRPDAFGENLTRRHVLGHLWRGRILGLLGDDEDDPIDPAVIEEHATTAIKGLWQAAREVGPFPALGHLLAHALTDHRCPRLLADAVLGSWQGGRPPPRWRSHGDLARRLTLGPRDRWFNVGTGCERLRCVVVDLDCKEEQDLDHLHARLRLFTGGAFPPPHLIVTSRSLRGRHLYWFTEERTRGYDRQSGQVWGAGVCSDVLVGRLRSAGVHVGPGTIEVFPQAKGRMPPLPFGHRSFLCGPDGLSISERDPVRSMLAWHARYSNAPLARYSAKDFLDAAVGNIGGDVLRVVSGPAPSRATTTASPVHRPVLAPLLPSRPRRSPRVPKPGQATTSRRRETDRELWESGAMPGQTWVDLPHVTRFIKHGLPGDTDKDRTSPTDSDLTNFDAWLHRGAYSTHHGESLRRLMRKFEHLFPNSLPYPSASNALTSAEVVGAVQHVSEKVQGRQPGLPWTQRKAFLTILLRMMSIATTRENGELVATWWARHEAHRFSDPTNCVRLMVHLGIIQVWAPHVPPRRWAGRLKGGKCAEYLVPVLPAGGRQYQLWSDGGADPMTPLDVVIDAIADDDALGAQLYGSLAGWRRLRARRR